MPRQTYEVENADLLSLFCTMTSIQRLERTAKHIQESRSKAAEKKKMWAAIDAES